MSPPDLDRDDLTLTLETGDEHNPGSRLGLVAIVVSREQVRVENRQVGLVRSWQARPRAELGRELRQRLRGAGFPVAPQSGLPPAGATFRVLRAEAGGSSAGVTLWTSAADRLPEWKALFQLFDTVARQTSGGALAIGQADAAALVEQ